MSNQVPPPGRLPSPFGGPMLVSGGGSACYTPRRDFYSPGSSVNVSLGGEAANMCNPGGATPRTWAGYSPAPSMASPSSAAPSIVGQPTLSRPSSQSRTSGRPTSQQALLSQQLRGTPGGVQRSSSANSSSGLRRPRMGNGSSSVTAPPAAPAGRFGPAVSGSVQLRQTGSDSCYVNPNVLRHGFDKDEITGKVVMQASRADPDEPPAQPKPEKVVDPKESRYVNPARLGVLGIGVGRADSLCEVEGNFSVTASVKRDGSIDRGQSVRRDGSIDRGQAQYAAAEPNVYGMSFGNNGSDVVDSGGHSQPNGWQPQGLRPESASGYSASIPVSSQMGGSLLLPAGNVVDIDSVRAVEPPVRMTSLGRLGQGPARVAMPQVSGQGSARFHHERAGARDRSVSPGGGVQGWASMGRQALSQAPQFPGVTPGAHGWASMGREALSQTPQQSVVNGAVSPRHPHSVASSLQAPPGPAHSIIRRQQGQSTELPPGGMRSPQVSGARDRSLSPGAQAMHAPPWRQVQGQPERVRELSPGPQLRAISEVGPQRLIMSANGAVLLDLSPRQQMWPSGAPRDVSPGPVVMRSVREENGGAIFNADLSPRQMLPGAMQRDLSPRLVQRPMAVRAPTLVPSPMAPPLGWSASQDNWSDHQLTQQPAMMASPPVPLPGWCSPDQQLTQQPAMMASQAVPLPGWCPPAGMMDPQLAALHKAGMLDPQLAMLGNSMKSTTTAAPSTHAPNLVVVAPSTHAPNIFGVPNLPSVNIIGGAAAHERAPVVRVMAPDAWNCGSSFPSGGTHDRGEYMGTMSPPFGPPVLGPPPSRPPPQRTQAMPAQLPPNAAMAFSPAAPNFKSATASAPPQSIPAGRWQAGEGEQTNIVIDEQTGEQISSNQILFEMFSSALADADTADKACRHLLAKFLGPDVVVQWSDLESLDPVDTLLRAVSEGCGLPNNLALPSWQLGSQECLDWWHALLARHGLYGRGDFIGAEEFGELMVSAFRILRDCHAPPSYLWNLRTVRHGVPRLKERYADFEFVSRGSLGKTYRCRSRLTRDERSCRQIRKDWIKAPVDHVRAEIALLRNIDHPNLPSVVETFEDYNSVYIIVDLVDALELMTFLHQLQTSGRALTKVWVADVMRQVLEALQYCHTLHPHSIVHGDLRLDSLVLAPTSDASSAPHIVIADLDLAGLLPPPPRNSHQPSWLHARTSRGAPWVEVASEALPASASLHCSSVSPKRDIWSCGCLLFLLTTGRHPLGGDAGGPLVPVASAAAPWEAWAHPSAQRSEPDWSLLEEVASSAVSLCKRMLETDPWKRASAGDCLDHPSLSAAPDSIHGELPLESLLSLVQLHARSKVRQVVTNVVVSELGPNPFETIAASLAILHEAVETSAEIPPILASMPRNIALALAQMNISESSLKKVVRAFGAEPGCSPVYYAHFFAGCADLAEDRFDHALWRIFTAAGEDNCGITTFAELDKQLKELPGSSDVVATMNAFLDQPPTRLGGEAVCRQATCASGEVTFEALKDYLVHRRSLEPKLERVRLSTFEDDSKQEDARAQPIRWQGGLTVRAAGANELCERAIVRTSADVDGAPPRDAG